MLVFALDGCRYESTCASQGRREFQKQHPDYTIVEIAPDGNEDSISYIAHYKKPNDNATYSAYVSVEINKTRKCEVSVREF
jgi:hypothetical protein